MGCHVIGAARCGLDNQMSWFAWKAINTDQDCIQGFKCIVAPRASQMKHLRLAHVKFSFSRKEPMARYLRKIHSMHITMEEESPPLKSVHVSTSDEDSLTDSVEDPLMEPLSSIELRSLLADSERSKLLKKLSEANQQNRLLKRELLVKENALVNMKMELSVMELEMQALSKLAEEIAQYGIPVGSRKINGKYVQTHLLSRINALCGRLKDHTEDVSAAQSKEVSLFWYGMAESVLVMGSFDGWSQGEQLSPEYNGSFTKFSSTLMLRPGRYEIKFLVDKEWHLSPELPTVGDGLMKNNLLIVT